MPFWLVGAVLVGAIIGAVASAAWIAVHRLAPERVWLAHLAAAFVAASLSAVPGAVRLSPLVLFTCPIVVGIALLAAPRVCLRRGDRRP